MKKTSTITLCLIAAFAMMAPSIEARQLSPSQALNRVKGSDGAQHAMRAPANASPTYTVTSGGQNTIYVFNLPDDGFMVVSADDVAVPLLGYSETGKFNASNIPENMAAWLQSYSREITEGLQEGVPAYAARKSTIKNETQIQPITKTLWDQSAPYNDQCPLITSTSGSQSRAVTGCVATAMAQIMKVHNWPATGSGSNSYTFYASGHNYPLSLDYDTISYDWSNMLNTYNSTATAEQKNAVATLMYSCGVAVDMSYGISESGAQGFNAGLALIKNFGYDKGARFLDHAYVPSDEWEQTIFDELAAGRPVMYFGQGAEGGHAFVCDGYSANGYFHFNWGWSGLSDGYYVLTALDPPALGIGGAGGGFNSDQQIIVGIQPPVPDSEASAVMMVQGTLIPTQQTYTSGQTITFSGVSGGAFIGSMSLSKITATLGFKLVDANGNVQYVKSDVVNHTFSPMSGYGTISAFASEFPEGSYTMTPAFQYNGEWRDVLLPLDYEYVLSVTSDGNTVSFSATQSQPEIIITSFTQDTPIFIGDLCSFTVDFEATADYYGDITPILMQYGTEVGAGSATTVSLSAGESSQYQWVTKFSGNGLTAGTYTLNFIDENDNLLSNGYQVTLQQQPDAAPTVTVSSVTFGNTQGTGRSADPILINPHDLNISITLQCSQGFWSDYVTGMFFDTSTLRSVGETESCFVGLDTDQSETVRITGQVSFLTPGQTYYFTPWAVNNNKQLSSTYYVKVVSDTGVDSINADKQPEYIFNINGEQMPSDQRLTPGIYIVRHGAKAEKVVIR